MKNCPKCGIVDWKNVSENVVQQYKKCGNCGYTPSFEKTESLDAKEWVLKLREELSTHTFEFDVWDKELAGTTKPTNKQIGNWNKSKRLMELSQTRLQVAEKLSEVVELIPEGQITLLLPNIGMWQFEWGGFNLFKAIGNEKNLEDTTI